MELSPGQIQALLVCDGRDFVNTDAKTTTYTVAGACAQAMQKMGLVTIVIDEISCFDGAVYLKYVRLTDKGRQIVRELKQAGHRKHASITLIA